MAKHRVLVPLLVLANLPAQGEVDARSTVVKGASVWIAHESTMQGDVTFGGKDYTTTEKVIWTLHVQVDDVDAEGNYLVTTKVVRVHGKLELAGAQGEAEFDSAAKADGSGAPIARQASAKLSEAAGKSFACKVGPKGDVRELGKGAKELVGDTERDGTMHTLNDDQLRQWVEGTFGVLPHKRTASGAKWKRVAPQWLGSMPTRQQLDCTLSEVDIDHFVIESTGVLELDKEAAKAAAAKGGDPNAAAQIENTRMMNSKVTGKQQTSRKDGFVSVAETSIAFDWETEDPRMGKATAKLQVATKTTRTTEAAAMQKPKPAAGDGKKG